MKITVVVTILLLLLSNTVFAGDIVSTISPSVHLGIALTVHYTLSTIFEHTIERSRASFYTEHPKLSRYGSRALAAAIVVAVAAVEYRSMHTFSGRDFMADLGGVGISFVVLEW